MIATARAVSAVVLAKEVVAPGIALARLVGTRPIDRTGGVAGDASFVDQRRHVDIVVVGIVVIANGRIGGNFDLAGVVAGGELGATHRCESVGHARGDAAEFGHDFGDSLALRLKMLLEMVDVGLEEVPAGEQRLHLALDANPLGLCGAARFGHRFLDDPGTFSLGGGQAILGGTLSLGDRAVGGALGQQQRSTDGLGFVNGNDTGLRWWSRRILTGSGWRVFGDWRLR